MTIEEAGVWLDKSPFHRKCGISVESIREGHCVLRAEVTLEDQNIWGIVHGGFIDTLCDAAAGMAMKSTRKEFFVTTTSTMHYLNPADCPVLRAEASVLKDGNTISLVEIRVHGDEKLIAEGTFEFFVHHTER